MGQLLLTLAFVLSIVNFAVFLELFRKQKNNYMFFTFVAIVVSCFGHWLLGFSESVDGAILSNKINYLGSAFLPMLMFFTLAEVCRLRILPVLRILLIVFSCFVLFLSFTVGYSDIYYKTVEFVVQSGAGNYVATYGWGHDVFNVMIILYAVLDIGVIVYACMMRRFVSLKNIFAMFMLELVTVSSFFISRHMENDMLCMPFVYLADQVFLLYISLNVKWYDIARSVMQSLEKDNGNAFVSFTSTGEYLGCNEIALKFFPKLVQCRVDRPIPSGHEMGDLFKPLLEQAVNTKLRHALKFWYANRHFRCTARTIPVWNVMQICLFRIEDDTKVQMYVDMLGKDHNQLVKVVEQNAQAVSAIQEQMIVGMANMVESRDGNTGGHIKRTSQVIRILASEMRKDMAYSRTDSFYDALISAAPMHDLGKIAIDDEILRKPGRFTDSEFAQMKTHAEKGAVIVENLLSGIEDPFFVQLSKNVANFHHERFDGTGYPLGLKGDAIPVEARIMAVADVYDALVSSRCYKDSMSYDKAGEIILAGMGTQFDPTLQKYFMDCEAKLREYYRTVEH